MKAIISLALFLFSYRLFWPCYTRDSKVRRLMCLYMCMFLLALNVFFLLSLKHGALFAPYSSRCRLFFNDIMAVVLAVVVHRMHQAKSACFPLLPVLSADAQIRQGIKNILYSAPYSLRDTLIVVIIGLLLFSSLMKPPCTYYVHFSPSPTLSLSP